MYPGKVSSAAASCWGVRLGDNGEDGWSTQNAEGKVMYTWMLVSVMILESRS